MDFLLTNWGAVVSIISGIVIIAINNYKTKKNTLDVEKMKENQVNFVDWDKARETFVSKELHTSQMGHIDITLGEIKQQNQQILEKLISK